MPAIDLPGRTLSPVRSAVSYEALGETKAARQLTSIDILLHEVGNATLVHLSRRLRLQGLSVLAGLEHARRVHGAMERVSLPAEEVIGVGAVALLVAEAQDERVRPVRGPH